VNFLPIWWREKFSQQNSAVGSVRQEKRKNFFSDLKRIFFLSFCLVLMLMSLVLGDATNVARWYIFKPKLPIWVNFGGS
jgi:hypothetical protein